MTCEGLQGFPLRQWVLPSLFFLLLVVDITLKI
jgi:hypothetical protein